MIIGLKLQNNFGCTLVNKFIDESLYPLVEIVPIQLLAYYAALEKDTDPDYPRNLAKSVTVK